MELALFAWSASAFIASPAAIKASKLSQQIVMQHSKGWDGFGKGEFKFYDGFDKFMSPFPDEDREAYPEMFRLPDQCYEVSLEKPLGIAFEEVEIGRGVKVDYLVDGGNAQAQGVIQPDDVLFAVTAVKVFGARWERKLVPALDLDFDQVIGAIGSNEPRYGARDVILMFHRPTADEATVIATRRTLVCIDRNCTICR